MMEKDTNLSFGEESASWLMCLFKNYLAFNPYWLGLMIILLYFPLIIVLIIFISGSILLNICKVIGNLPLDPDSEKWRKPLLVNAFVYCLIAKVLHGHEICGMENFPEGPAILVFFHGGLPVDNFFLIQEIYRRTGRSIRVVIDHFFFLMPGLQTFFFLHGAFPPSREACVDLLKKGHVLSIAPGGVREQNYGDNTYKLIWGNRQGFAHVAIEAKVPIIPYFTKNIQEGYRVWGNTGIMRWVYERTRLLLFPILGPFPVKLQTYIGEPIPYDPNITAEELFQKTKAAIEALREKHQKVPGSIWRALGERFKVHHKEE